jgi:hypothetical protein
MAANLARHVGKTIFVDVDQKDVRAFLGKRMRNGAADARRGTCNQRFLATNDPHLVSSL